MTTAGQDRLFVALTAEAFGWWLQGKTHELRHDEPRWSEKHVYRGRRVELRRGYSGPSLWGTIGARETGPFGAAVGAYWLSKIVPPGVVYPQEKVRAVLRCDDDAPVVVFEVLLDAGQGVGE